MEIKITKLANAPFPGNFKGFFDVEIEGIIIRGCRIVQQPNMKAYISGPTRQDGKRWFTIVSFPDHIRDQIEAIVIPQAKKNQMIE